MSRVEIEEISITDTNIGLVFEATCIDSSYSREELFLKKVEGTQFRNSLNETVAYIYVDGWVMVDPTTLKIKFVEKRVC